MKPLPYSRTRLPRALIVSLVLLGTSSIVFQLLRAQSVDASSGTSPATNSSTAQGTTNAVSEVAPPQAATNAPTVQGTANQTNAISEVAPPQATTNAPTAQGATNQTNAVSEVPPPGEMSSPEGQDNTNQPNDRSESPPPNDMSEGLPGEIPNSAAVQDITNQKTGGWDNLWQGGSPIHFGLTAGETYDDNVFISPNKTSSFLTHISPSIDFQKGDQTAPDMHYLNLYFAPNVVLYQNLTNKDRIDYNGDIYYQYSWTRLTLSFEQNYQHLTDANLDVGNLVSRNIYTTKLNAYYYYNDDLSLYGTATQQVNNYPGLTINEWDLDSYALYRVAPKLLVGAGPRFCFLDITGAPNETHQDLLARLKYFPDRKFTVAFDGGVEYLQYQDNTPSRLLPTFDGNVTYSPVDGTGLFLSAGREILNSYDLRGDTFAFTTVQTGVSQRFLQDVNFTVSMGYNMANYESTAGADDNGLRRKDNYYFAKGGVEWDPNRWLKVEASYQWSENHSTFSQNSFNDNQVDVQSSVHF